MVAWAHKARAVIITLCMARDIDFTSQKHYETLIFLIESCWFLLMKVAYNLVDKGVCKAGVSRQVYF